MSQLPKYERSPTPTPMRFQERDGQILRAIYEYDGVLAKRQLKAMFWPDATWRAMEMRLSLLYHQGYLDWPNALQWRTRPIPEAVCWLGWKGALWLVGQAGIETTPIESPSETKLRQLSRELRNQGIRWQREPRWQQLHHDLSLVDFRLTVEKSVRDIPQLELEKWVSEGDFLVRTDRVEYHIEAESGSSKLVRRGVRPDGYFVLKDRQRSAQGLPARARFLVEIDMATHDLTSFVTEKVWAGWHYIQSPAYKARFGDNTGSWLVVTATETRRKHLMHSAHNALGPNSKVFLFTTLAETEHHNILNHRIWWQVQADRPTKLLGC